MPVGDIITPTTLMGADWWLKAAQGTVRRYCGWHVAPSVSETLRVDAYGGRALTLPSKHVTDVTSILALGEDVTDKVDWSESGTMQLRSGCWPDAPGAVKVTLTHGYSVDEVPDVAALIMALGKRAQSGARRGPVTARAVNGASESIATAGGAPIALPLLTIEKETLDAYRLNWGPR